MLIDFEEFYLLQKKTIFLYFRIILNYIVIHMHESLASSFISNNDWKKICNMQEYIQYYTETVTE